MTNFVKKSLYESMRNQRDAFCKELVKTENAFKDLLTKLDRQIETGNISGAKVLITHIQELMKKGEWLL